MWQIGWFFVGFRPKILRIFGWHPNALDSKSVIPYPYCTLIILCTYFQGLHRDQETEMDKNKNQSKLMSCSIIMKGFIGFSVSVSTDDWFFTGFSFLVFFSGLGVFGFFFSILGISPRVFSAVPRSRAFPRSRLINRTDIDRFPAYVTYVLYVQ